MNKDLSLGICPIKVYLKFLVSEIKVEKKKLVVRGSKRALAEVVSSLNPENTATTVPSSIIDWRARKDESGHWTEIIRIVT